MNVVAMQAPSAQTLLRLGRVSNLPTVWTNVIAGATIANTAANIIDIALIEVKYFSQYQEREAFKALPKSVTLAAGIVDEACYWIEPVKKIRERIGDWARVVGEERLWVSTSCGFNRHPSRNIPVLRQKVENMVEAARTL